MIDNMPADGIHILVIPVFGQILVVPVALIEEVLPVPEISENPDLPDVFAGEFDWRGKSVGLTSFSRLSGGKMEKPVPGNRVVVFKPLEGCNVDEQFALLISADPEPRAVGRMDLQKDVNAPGDNPMIVSYCTLDGRAVGIPNMAEWKKKLCMKE
ncbi:MAG: hypothetical protein DSZ32_01665 [Gammaproteobacteria bacterium]|nr:MAG: hypothetical protein DSZ32_01665 [Gammaproteobacteria bacterium]RTZ61742.1 MAG: hypothetical protein DSZ33_00490 [Gammaproteobacteria bacterium]